MPFILFFIKFIDVSNVLINENNIVKFNIINFNFAVKTENLEIVVTIRGEIEEIIR